MAQFTVQNVAVKGMAACVPKEKESNSDFTDISERDRQLMIKTTGVQFKRRAPKGLCSSDLCFTAAQQLLKDLGWKNTDVELLIFVSQSPDYFLPATSIILQSRLGLPKTALSFDINLGCSGYVYGLSVVGSIMSSSGIKKALLLSGDVSTVSVSPHDKSAYPLFGDAGTATALEFTPGAAPIFFNLQSKGEGYEAIMIPDGACRNPLTDESYKMEEKEKGVVRSRKNLWLNGLDVFNFSVTEVPPNIKATLQFASTDFTGIDFFVMHQANLLLNETIRKVLQVDAAKAPYSLHDYGNTSSASIPLTMVTAIAGALKQKQNTLLLTGFGVGLSWGSVLLKTDSLTIPSLLEI